MSPHIRFMSAIALFTALSPAFAQARNGEGTMRPVRHLVEIPGASASALHGRAAEMALLQPVFTLSDPEIETAGTNIPPSNNVSGG